jgi:hypothetical protein
MFAVIPSGQQPNSVTVHPLITGVFRALLLRLGIERYGFVCGVDEHGWSAGQISFFEDLLRQSKSVGPNIN